MSTKASPRHRAEVPRRRGLRAALIVVVSLALVVGIGVTLVYRKLDGNLSVVDADALIGGDRPDEAKVKTQHKPLNVLLIGSDSRIGSDIGGDSSGLADTVILLHLSGDRERAYGVSIPRDLMIERPTCTNAETGAEIPASNGLEQFNAAFAYGGPACTMKTVEQMTDVRVHHFVEVNFNGFREMVDALGGVPICVPEEVNDTYGKIHLRAGSYEANGREALDYVRTRSVISNNGDVGRMRRQQAFLAAMTNKAVSLGTLANPVKLYNFLDAATKSIRLDEGLDSPAKLGGLAKQLTDIGLDNVQFLSVPFEWWSEDRNRLVLTEDADELWELIREDRPLSRRLSTDVITAAEPPTQKRPDTAGSGNPGTAAPDPSTPNASAGPSAGPTTAEQERAERARANGLCA